MSSSIAQPTNAKKVPFQAQTLSDFVGLVGRLFYDDACIVLLDFLAREQRSFLEADLRDKLGWREALIQQKLYLLEKHLIVAQDTGVARGAARAPVYWRISHHIHSAVQFRYQQLVDRLAKLVEDATRQHEFECSESSCATKYSALDVAGCTRALEDEHPLCTRCGSPLKPSAFEETLQQAKEKRARALRQLDPLRQSLLRVSNMDIPVFRAYSKQEQKPASSVLQPSGGVQNKVSDGPVEAQQHGAKVGLPRQAVSASAARGQSSTFLHVAGSSATAVSAEAQHRIAMVSSENTGKRKEDLAFSPSGSMVLFPSLSSRGAGQAVSAQATRSIPWFDSSSAAQSASSSRAAHTISASGSAHQIISMNGPTNVSPSWNGPSNGGQHTYAATSVSSLDASQTSSVVELGERGSQKISFGLKSGKPAQSASFHLSTTAAGAGDPGKSSHRSGSLCSGSTPSGRKIEFNVQNNATDFASCSPGRSGATSTGIFADDTIPGSRHEGELENEDVEIEVSRLGRKVKLSEVTEDIEQCMTDEEYKIYYNAASELSL